MYENIPPKIISNETKNKFNIHVQLSGNHFIKINQNLIILQTNTDDIFRH